MVKKLDISYIKEYSLTHNIVCLSEEYEKSNIHLKFECLDKHIFYMSWDNFKQGYRCNICSGNKKLTIDYIKNKLNTFGYKCNSTVYINANSELELECNRGHKYISRWGTFQSGKRCKQCKLEYRIGENHHNWNPDRTRTLRAQYLGFDLKKYKILNDDLNYNNYLYNKNLYNIDHINPRIAFIDNDLDKLYDKKIIKKICNLRENLRIITKEENLSKRAKYNQEEFMNWFNKKIKDYEICSQ